MFGLCRLTSALPLHTIPLLLQSLAALAVSCLRVEIIEEGDFWICLICHLPLPPGPVMETQRSFLQVVLDTLSRMTTW